MLVGRWALGILMIVFGAVVNAIYLAVDPAYYANFADASPFAFVRNAWESLVVPNLWFFITLLIIFELIVGAMVLSGGRRTQLGLVALIAFHVGQLAFGGAMWIWRRSCWSPSGCSCEPSEGRTTLCVALRGITSWPDRAVS